MTVSGPVSGKSFGDFTQIHSNEVWWALLTVGWSMFLELYQAGLRESSNKIKESLSVRLPTI